MKIRLQKKVSVITSTIQTSLAMVIPILFIGSITVMLNSFLIQAYQDFLNSFLGGALRSVIQTIQFTTVGILAVYLTIALYSGIGAYRYAHKEMVMPLHRPGRFACVHMPYTASAR